MLNTLYNFEADSLFELIPALDGLFSYNEIMQFDIAPYYRSFVTAELKWRLLDSFIPFIQCNNIHLEDDFEKTLNNFFIYSCRYAYFDAEELREIFKTAVKYKINAIFHPVELMNLHFFTNNYIISKAELFIKKDYFVDDSIAADIANSFFNKYGELDNLGLINRGDFRKFINVYSSTLIENSAKLEKHLNFIREFLAEFSLEFNIYNISLLFKDLNINYVADKLRINFKDDYVPSNQVIINFLENDEILKDSKLKPQDEFVNLDNEELLIQPIIDQEIIEINKKSIFDSSDDFDILDNIMEEISQKTDKEINDKIDQSIDDELSSIKDSNEENDSNDQIDNFDKFKDINEDVFFAELNETNITQESKKDTSNNEYDNDLYLNEAINNELKSIMDIINL